MTNAMPFLQMTIKLSYGWRGLCLPRTQGHKLAKCTAQPQKTAIVPYISYNNNMVPPGGGKPLPVSFS